MAKDWNYIKHIFMHHCGVSSPKIIIETALEAAIPTMWEMLEYTCTDIIAMKGGATWGTASKLNKSLNVGTRRSGSRRGGRCGKKISPVLGKGIAPAYVDGFKFIYEISGIAFARNVLYKFFLFELGKDFIINWMSLAYAAERCDLPWAGTIFTGWDALFTPGPEREITCFINPGSTKCATAGGHEIHVPPGCQVGISWLGNWLPFRNDPALMGNVTMWLEDDAGKTWASTTPRLSPGQMSVQQGGGAYNLPGRFPDGTTYRLKAMIHSGLMGPEDRSQSLTIVTGGRPVHLLPMQGCVKSAKKRVDDFWGYLNSKTGYDSDANKTPNPWFRPVNSLIYGPDQDGIINR